MTALLRKVHLCWLVGHNPVPHHDATRGFYQACIDCGRST